MPASKRLRGTGHGTPVPLVTGVANRLAGRTLAGNPGTADVRGRLDTRVITLTAPTAADFFTLRVKWQNPNRAVFPEFDAAANHDGYTDTDSIIIGTNATSAAIQALLRTATGDSALTVSGSTDTGPFTVSPGGTGIGPHRESYELQAVALSGMSVAITSAPVTYVAALGRVQDYGTDTGQPTASSPGRQAGLDVPLGYSTVTDGPGQTAQATMVTVVIDSAVGGDDLVTISGTEDASGGTSAVVGYSVFKTADDTPHSTVYREDADGDLSLTGLESGVDYYVIGFTQAENGSDNAARSRVSAPSAPVFFTTS